ncbi:MAG: FecR domain-containing protein [Spirochaetales bacterium]|nr:FecR domain-containing protein [Spirochaetales bacterium]
MNNRKFFVVLFLCLATLLTAIEAEITYSQGEVSIRDSFGDNWLADPGFRLSSGDTVTTGADGHCEIIDGSTQITIAPDTVFQYLEYSDSGKSVSGFQCVLGQMNLVLQNITGSDPGPRISTASTVAGVRGTKLSVIASADGNSLVVVQEGRVEVQAAGKSVEVNAEQGVEVVAGNAPGQVFEVLRGQMDFSNWIEKQNQAFLDNPMAALEKADLQMKAFIEQISALNREFLEGEIEMKTLREKLDNLEGNEKKNFYAEVIFPREVHSSYLQLNIRYFVLSALSMRRYMMTSIYIKVKMNWLIKHDFDWAGFSEKYNRILATFENQVMPYLVLRDI